MNPHSSPPGSGRRPGRQLFLTTLTATALVLAAAPAFGLAGDGDQKVEREVRVIRLHPDGADEGEVHKERRVVVLGDGDGSRGFAWRGDDRPLQIGAFVAGGYLGVELTSLTAELRGHFGAPGDAGVMVARVEDDSPAAAAGLRVGDIITSVDGETVASPQLVGMAVRSHEPGETVQLMVVRDGRALDFDVEVGERQRQALDVAPLLRWRDENGEVDLEALRERAGGDGPHVFQFRSEDGGEPMVFELRGMEGLERSLEEMDWQQLVAPRRETLERIEELEKRLQELERELERARRDR
jgi:hypothetical protein